MYAAHHRTAAEKRARVRADRKRRAYLNIWKHASGCVDCGYRGHVAALEFDHRPGEIKLGMVGNFKGSWEALDREIAKCDVVCANCHRIRTTSRLNAA